MEQERFNELKKIFDNEFNTFLGRKFEKFILNLIKDKKILNSLSFDSLGNQWGKSDKGTYEIDILALNESKKEALFGECKWKENVNSLEILNEIEEKTKFVNWHNKERKEIFAVFAKSFSKKVSEFNGRKVYCFDLKNIESELK